MKDTRLNEGTWTPKAEVVQRLAVNGSYLYPTGKEMHTYDGRANVTASDVEPLFDQTKPPLGIWTNMTVHIHPVAESYIGNQCNNGELRPEIFTWYDTVRKAPGRLPSQGPSPGDKRVQEIAETKNPDRRYRSIVVGRHIIYLYNKNADYYSNEGIMRIFRRNPQTK